MGVIACLLLLQSRGKIVTRAFVLKKDGGSPRLPSCALVMSHSRAGRTLTTRNTEVLRGFLRLDVAELARVRGLGHAKAVRVKAALE